MLIVRSPVRISFFGGGTDLPDYYEKHGGAVISAPINKYVYVLITEQPDHRVQLISADLRMMQMLDDVHPEMPEGELQIPMAAIKHIGLDRGANIFLASEIQPGTGLGSSGAVSVAMVLALSTYQQRHFDKYALAEAAFHVNAEMLGHPGGKQDEYGSAFGGLKRIEFRAEGVAVHPLDIDPLCLRAIESNLMLFFTGDARDSADILGRQKQACTEERTDTLDVLARMKEMVDEGLRVLQSGDLRRFGELLDEGWDLKKRMAEGISNPHIDGLYQIARENGAIGGKVTGAGGGGFLLIYCEPEARAAVSRAMEQAGAREMLFAFDVDGATVVHNEPLFGSRAARGETWQLLELT